MRGTPLVIPVRGLASGIIPAYAGNTTLLISPCTDRRDHPRVCGEHQTNLSNQQTMQGSSPRMRGTRGAILLSGGVRGIIPAYAGNTLVVSFHWILTGDHPRVCGEHVFVQQFDETALGSSPRMRGTPPHTQKEVFERGIIPAYAGNTRRRV